MIESLSDKWATWVKVTDQNNPFTYEFLNSSAKTVLNLFFCYLIVLTVGHFTGRLFDSFLALQSFVTLRIFSGGYHLKSLDLCTIVSAALILPVPYIADYLSNISVYALNFVSLILAAIYAPTNLRSTFWTDKAKPVFKLLTISLILLNFHQFSPIIAVSFTLQTLFLVKFK